MNKLFLLLIRLYQRTRIIRPACCRFYPSCSEYAYISIERYGLLKGMLFGLGRILRCHPFCAGGIDYVPEKGER